MRRGKRRYPGRVRIIGGRWRGTRIDVLEEAAVRPTPDRVRETLFNWLNAWIAGARCLDLYAGTGVLGFEALSRGAGSACFVERDQRLAAAIATCARSLGANAEVVCGDAMGYLDTAAAASFDIAFVDPPYELALSSVLAKLSERAKSGALVYAERPAGEGLPEMAGLKWLKRGRAGAVCYGLGQIDGRPD